MNDQALSRDRLIRLEKWADAKNVYYGRLTLKTSGERVEQYGAERHGLDTLLPAQQEFWRCHIAPATNRPVDHFLAPGVSPVISRMAELNYEIFCNLLDAMDQLAEIERTGDEAPRYRKSFMVWRYAGDAIMIVGELQDVLEARGDHAATGLARILDVPLRIFSDDFALRWKRPREAAVQYRNVLVHRGRPWLFFKGRDFETIPYIRWDGTISPQDHSHETREKQDRDFRDPANSGNYLPLSEAAREVAMKAVQYVDAAFVRIVDRLAFLLDDPNWFRKYRTLWAWPQAGG